MYNVHTEKKNANGHDNIRENNNKDKIFKKKREKMFSLLVYALNVSLINLRVFIYKTVSSSQT